MISTINQQLAKAANENTDPDNNLSGDVNPEDTIIIMKDGNIYGDESANVSIIVFTDFECPFCKNFHPILKKIADGSSGSVNFEYKNFPLSFHENAYFEAAAGECMAQVGENDQYWKFIDFLFAESYPDVYAIEVPVIATGADIIDFYDCVAEETPWNHVDEDYALGESIGVIGTPSIIINNNETGSQMTFHGSLTENELADAIAEVQTK